MVTNIETQGLRGTPCKLDLFNINSVLIFPLALSFPYKKFSIDFRSFEKSSCEIRSHFVFVRQIYSNKFSSSNSSTNHIFQSIGANLDLLERSLIP